MRVKNAGGLTHRGHGETARDVMPGSEGDIAGRIGLVVQRGEDSGGRRRGRRMVLVGVLRVGGTGVIRLGEVLLRVRVGLGRSCGGRVGGAGGLIVVPRVVAGRGVLCGGVVGVARVHGEQERHERGVE